MAEQIYLDFDTEALRLYFTVLYRNSVIGIFKNKGTFPLELCPKLWTFSENSENFATALDCHKCCQPRWLLESEVATIVGRQFTTLCLRQLRFAYAMFTVRE